MSLWEFLEPRLSVQGPGVPIFWWVYDLACQVAQKCQGTELWGVGMGLVWEFWHICVFKAYNYVFFFFPFQVLSTMARRPRSSRAWHFVLSAARRDTDARTVALAGTTNWGYDSDGQVGPSSKVVMTSVWIGSEKDAEAGDWTLSGYIMLRRRALWPGK